MQVDHSVSGRAYLRKLKGGDAYYAHLRYYPSRRDRRPKLGPAWKQKSTPPAGFLTKRMAEAALQELLVAERRKFGAVDLRGGGGDTTFLAAADEWLRWTEVERGRRGTTMADYRNAVDRVLVPALGGETMLAAIDPPRVEALKAAWMARLTARTTNKYLVMLNGIFKRAKRLGWVDDNPLEKVDRLPLKRDNRFQHLEADEVEALARASENEQDAALYITAAFTGLRMGELRQLRWEDVAFTKHLVHVRQETKSGLARSVPMIDRVAQVLENLSRRAEHTEAADYVFPNELGTKLDDSKLRKAYVRSLKRAGLAPIRFHDLRHTFGTLAVREFPLTDVQVMMGHADIHTTRIYIHYVPQGNAAEKLARAMRADRIAEVTDADREAAERD